MLFSAPARCLNRRAGAFVFHHVLRRLMYRPNTNTPAIKRAASIHRVFPLISSSLSDKSMR
nr:MAG TPA: hypothetical protein [Caudoviricetes sp.]DAR87076.1 MAG TPA: hypothetical protein [Caudoviricetes sp.]